MMRSTAMLSVFALLVACSGSRGDGSGDGSISDTLGSSSTATDSAESGGPKFDVLGGNDLKGGSEAGDDACQKVDILFVIDNSQSFEDEQINLIASFPGFISTMQATLDTIDSYHIGITTSDAYSCTPAPCNVAGALVTETCGSFSSNMTCGPYAGGTYMTEADDLDSAFACAAQVGTSGNFNEQPMLTMGLAIDPQLNAAGACNEGFSRDDALLVIVVITDEEDDVETMCNLNPGSPGEPIDWFNTVVGHKGGVESNVVVLALVGPEPPNDCPPRTCGVPDGAEVCARIVDFTEMFTHGFIDQVCAPSYDAFFQQAVDVIDSACDDFNPPG